MQTKRRGSLRWNGFILLVLLLLVWGRVCYANVSVDYIEPGFIASPMITVDDQGVFLASMNGTFILGLQNPANDENYYLCIQHNISTAVVWSANRGSAMNQSDMFQLTESGAVIQNSVGRTLWSTGAVDSVQRMQLRDDGNLVILDAGNKSLWESFNHPTDTLLLGQQFVLGSSLVSNAALANYTPGDYEVLLTDRDLVLVWTNRARLDNQTYWSMAGDSQAVQVGPDSTAVVSAALTDSGFSLYSKSNVSSRVWPFQAPAGALRRAVIQPSGHFDILSFISNGWVRDYRAMDECQLPETCGPLGICTSLNPTVLSQCSCPEGLRVVNQTDVTQGCSGQDQIPSCDVNYTDLLMKNSLGFVSLGTGVDYFADQFQNPIQSSISIDNCKRLCLRNCSCASVFFKNDSGSCFMYETLGTLRSNAGTADSAFLKVINKQIISMRSSAGPVLPIAVGLVGGILLAALSICIGLLWCRKREEKILPQVAILPDVEDEHLMRSTRCLPTRFSYRELQAATDDFANEIGSGAYAVVYEGTLPEDGTKIAVKKLHSATYGKGSEEFYSEIATIGCINHMNLVKLRGFCIEGPNRLLVFEFMNRGSLDRFLFDPEARPVLEWNERYDIALGTAKGLAYLHEECSEKIIHCDIKPENILLNDKSQTKVSDFGLAKLISREQSQAVVSNMRGTRGYIAPEWLTNKPITHKTDVYSYGMVLLEIVGGRKNYSPLDSSSNPEFNVDLICNLDYFPAYALQLCQQGGPFSELADPRLEGRIPAEEVEKLVKIALCCLHEDSNMRPSMSKVVHMLEGNVPVGDPQLESLLFLRFYARRINSNISIPNFMASSLLGSRNWFACTTRSPSFNWPPQMSIISSAQLSEAR